nr:unnamed protein product [Leishmania braziliensis]
MGQVGGTATSGRGLTAPQVVAALRVTVEAQLKKADAAAPSSQAASCTRASLAEHSKAIKPVDCCAVQRLTVPSTDSKGKRVKVHVTEYAPNVFSFLRQLEGVADSHFADEWSLPEDCLRMELGEGRSQAFFLKSKTMAFMCKTISVEEVRVLLDILHAYMQHIAAHPGSLLMRFYMLLKVSVRKEKGYILCFNDIFAAASVLHEKWDIKGRIPKPGKSLRNPDFLRRGSELNLHLIEAQKKRNGIVKPVTDASEQLYNREDGVVVKEAKGAQSPPTLHDKDLTRLFLLPQNTRKRLLEQLLRDYDFLNSAGMMDYSLLIGVTYHENKAPQSGRHCISDRMSNSAQHDAASASSWAEVRPGPLAKDSHLSDKKTSHSVTPPEFANGVRSVCEQEIYYVGIIDVLTAYTIKKKGANFFKSFLWEQNMLSTIPPDYYARRLTSFTELIFPDASEESRDR